MDIIFKCPHCDQDLEVEGSGAGSSIQCPSCSNIITVPAQEPSNMVALPVPPAPPPVEEKHFSVPAHEGPSEALIEKAKRPLEVVAKEGDKKMRIRTIKRTDCQEVGRDRFDEKVSEFLERVGQANIVSINTVSYSGLDMATHNQVNDYGVLIVFKG